MREVSIWQVQHGEKYVGIPYRYSYKCLHFYVWNRCIKSGKEFSYRMKGSVKYMGQQRSGGPTSERPALPSTYQQVLENMRYIQEELLPKIEILNNTVFNPDPDDESGKSDIILDPNEIMKVVGVSVVVSNMGEDTPPSGYERNVTFELKSTNAIGLNGRKGITLPLVLVRTIRMHDVEGVEGYPTWQCAYGDIAMTMYFRKSEDDVSWGDWVPVVDLPTMLEEHEELMQKLSHRQFVQSDTEPLPDEQEPGDYWVQSIFPEGYFLQNVLNNTDIKPLNPTTAADYTFEKADTGEPVAGGTMDDYTLTDTTEEGGGE